VTPKQKYDERKRLRMENDLRAEQRRKDRMDRDEDMEEFIASVSVSLKRIADVLELWADQQEARDAE